MDPISERIMSAMEPTERTVDESSSEHPTSPNGSRRPSALAAAPRRLSRGKRVSSRGKSLLSASSEDNLASYFGSVSSDFDGISSEGGDGRRDSGLTPELAEQEARHVRRSKVLVALVLIGSTSLLGYFTYKTAEKDSEQQFEHQFLGYADEIVDQSKNNAFSSFSVLESFSKTVTSLALFANTSWPLVTLPHFEIRASDYLEISGAQEIAFAPIVQDEAREPWEAYTLANKGWIQDGLDLEYVLRISREEASGGEEEETKKEEADNKKKTETIAPGTNMEGFSVLGTAKPIQKAIWKHAPFTHRAIVETSKGPHVPIWQAYPAPRNSYVVNYNLLSSPEFEELINITLATRRAVLSDVIDNFVLFGNAQTIKIDPKSVIIQPIFESFHVNANVAGFLIVVIPWFTYFNDVLSKGAAGNPVVCVLTNSCGEAFSYKVDGPEATFLGEGDWHDTKFDHLHVETQFASFAQGEEEQHYLLHHQVQSVCEFSLHVYPTQSMAHEYDSSTPIFITMAVVGIFAFTSLVFLLYDVLVQRRQSKVAQAAQRTTAIISSLFPQEVHDRLFASPLAAHPEENNQAPKFRLRSFLSDEEQQQQQQKQNSGGALKNNEKDAPIADLFPECTVMFCDISGFTAWSSTREPSQVFILLENVYSAFDAIANKRKVFKVETIGDSYLAVAGLPTPRRDHALVMVKFSRDCLIKMKSLAKSLELELGPGTDELTMRFGLHSGPVTAGVLRGEKTRFQLFGDTVNTASRMESTGERDKIQVSEETATLLKAGGKERWLKARETKIVAKGKGELQTYWANPRSSDSESHTESNHSDDDPYEKALRKVVSTRELHDSIAFKRELDGRHKRIVHWIAEIMVKLLKQLAARRIASGGSMMKSQRDLFSTQFAVEDMPIDEVVDIITLPKFDPKAAKRQSGYASVNLPDDALTQLHNYIAEIALLYNENAFHNLEHAGHVTMSVSKLLARIVRPEVDPSLEGNKNKKQYESARHDHTYGITSDPMTQFAVVFAALIHDADHPGYPNKVLVDEQTPLATKYQGKSVAEQHSFDLCWNVLKSERYNSLRACIYTTEDELKRFRQLVVNSIIATDISDKTLGANRKARWNIAFHGQENSEASSVRTSDEGAEAAAAVNRKATIVIEHLIQASDVAHCMQHWHIYQKWNGKLFKEMYQAYKAGKLEDDPSKGWYEGELGFFDFYIIPLAKKLKDCGVFGVSSDEYLQYALANRREWERRGKDIVKEFMDKYTKPSSSSYKSKRTSIR